MENLYELLEEAAHKVPTKGIVIVNNSQGIGVDIEDQTTILSKKEYSLFCTPQEIACIDKKEFSPIDIFSRKEAILKAYYTAYSKLCNWIDIDTINVSKASNVTIICMLKKNFIINLCCVEK